MFDYSSVVVLSSSIREVGEAIDALVRTNEVFTVPSGSVVSLLSDSEVSARQYFMFRLELAAHAIECNQHNEDQAANGKSWLAQQFDIPEHLASSYLSGLKKLVKHPDVLDEARNGTLSFEKASMIARVADGSASCEEEMMGHARSESYEHYANAVSTSKQRKKTPKLVNFVCVSRNTFERQLMTTA